MSPARMRDVEHRLARLAHLRARTSGASAAARGRAGRRASASRPRPGGRRRRACRGAPRNPGRSRACSTRSPATGWPSSASSSRQNSASGGCCTWSAWRTIVAPRSNSRRDPLDPGRPRERLRRPRDVLGVVGEDDLLALLDDAERRPAQAAVGDAPLDLGDREQVEEAPLLVARDEEGLRLPVLVEEPLAPRRARCSAPRRRLRRRHQEVRALPAAPSELTGRSDRPSRKRSRPATSPSRLNRSPNRPSPIRRRCPSRRCRPLPCSVPVSGVSRRRSTRRGSGRRSAWCPARSIWPPPLGVTTAGL